MNFHIFIASCVEGLDIQVPRLIKNILDVNIPVEYVHFIVGGCSDEKTYYINGIEIVEVNYRCFEFTPMIYIVNNSNKYNFEYAFFTHDTVKFGINFYNTIKNDITIIKNNNYDTMRIENPSTPNQPGHKSMNIGVYSKQILLNHKNMLLEITIYTNDKNQLMNLKHKLCYYEDLMFNINNYNNGDYSENTIQMLNGINSSNYHHGYIRYYKRIDFIKYQTNAHHVQSIDICKIE